MKRVIPKGYFKILFLFLLVTSFSSAPKHISPNYQNLQDNLNPLVTDGLYYAEFYDLIYRGHFEYIEMTRNDQEFLAIFEKYLRSYGRNCSQYLPKDKVEILELVCVRENVTTNGYGIEVSRYCIEWKWDGTGLYARKDLYEAKVTIQNMKSDETLASTLGKLNDPNLLGNSVDVLHKANGLNNDMRNFFSLNNCDSKAVKQFEENLKRFALNETSIRIDKASKYVEMKKIGGPTGAQNFEKLINDFIKNQSKTWSFNRYVGNSISNLVIHTKDEKERPREISASYSYTGFAGNKKGSVRVTFTNGLPDCIYFFDFPQNCKTPNSSLLNSYAKGNYSR